MICHKYIKAQRAQKDCFSASTSEGVAKLRGVLAKKLDEESGF